LFGGVFSRSYPLYQVWWSALSPLTSTSMNREGEINTSSYPQEISGIRIRYPIISHPLLWYYEEHSQLSDFRDWEKVNRSKERAENMAHQFSFRVKFENFYDSMHWTVFHFITNQDLSSSSFHLDTPTLEMSHNSFLSFHLTVNSDFIFASFEEISQDLLLWSSELVFRNTFSSLIFSHKIFFKSLIFQKEVIFSFTSYLDFLKFNSCPHE
jgi:hypothetical protein